MGGFRWNEITTYLTCAGNGSSDALLPGIITRPTSIAPALSTFIPVCRRLPDPPLRNMSALEVERPVVIARRRFLPITTIMPKSNACRKLVFEPDPSERDEDGPTGAAEENNDNCLTENVQRQSQRWGFDFISGQPLANGRLNWSAAPEESVPSYYRESCLRSPPRRNPRALRRSIMSARRSESTEQQHHSSRTLPVGQMDTSRMMPVNTREQIVASARSETETASVAPSRCFINHHLPISEDNTSQNGCNSVETHNNGLTNSSQPSTSKAWSNKQSHIDDFFSQRKRRRSSSESREPSAKRTKSLVQVQLDRPRSAPAAVATSS